jgi:hypothetical protein
MPRFDQEPIINDELYATQLRDWYASENFGVGVRNFGSLTHFTDDDIRRAFHAGFAAAFGHIVQRGYSFKKLRARRAATTEATEATEATTAATAEKGGI